MNFVLIDWSWILHRSYHAYSQLSAKVEDGREVKTGPLFGFVKLVLALRARYKVDEWHLVFCLDDGHGGRDVIFPGYKAGREYKPEVHALDDDILLFLRTLPGASVVFGAGYEADDVMATMVSKAPGRVVVFSGDDDMLQLAKDGKVDILRSFDGTIAPITEASIEKDWGVPVHQLLMYRSIIGDSSDKIPSIRKRFTRTLAVEASKRYLVPSDIEKETCWISPLHREMRSPNMYLDWERNFKIMTLFRDIKIEYLGPYPRSIVETLAAKYNMKTLLKFV